MYIYIIFLYSSPKDIVAADSGSSCLHQTSGRLQQPTKPTGLDRTPHIKD